MDNTSTPPTRFRFLSTTLGRLIALLVLTIALLIPLAMIREVINERSVRRAQALSDITSSWGGPQTLVGPVLRIPCIDRSEVKDDKGWTQERLETSMLYVLPERLQVDAALQTEVRRRGLFDVPVYVAALELQGHFTRPSLSECPGRATSIDWSGAELLLGLSAPRGLHADTRLSWNGRPLGFEPATGIPVPPLASGIHASLEPIGEVFGERTADFTIELGLNGAQQLQLAPVAKETQVRMNADWAHPSFQGTSLPTQRSSNRDSFSAHWSISYLGRDYPQLWSDAAIPTEAVDRSLFGVTLLQPVDPYVMAERISKYAILTVVFTFLTVWLTEVLCGRRIHVIQYGFIGAALCLFGLLQLSLAEHVGFNIAFVAAMIAVTALVTLYCRSVVGGTGRALLVGTLLTGLYAYLYSLLRAEDYALLGGTAALFVLLATAMYLTRRVDWSHAGAAQDPG